MGTFASLTRELKPANSAAAARKAGQRPAKTPERHLPAWRTHSDDGGGTPQERLACALPNLSAQLQTKLEVSQPGDELEQEADRVAAQVMRMPMPFESAGTTAPGNVSDSTPAPDGQESLQREAEPTEEEPDEAVQRACSSCMHAGGADEELQRKLELHSQSTGRSSRRPARASVQFATALGRARASSGAPLPAPVRSSMEPRFGKSFDQVRLHRDASASQLAKSVQAKAFTVGSDVFFADGQFEPATPRGQRLIAHELTHVLQQRAGLRSVQRELLQRQWEQEPATPQASPAPAAGGLIVDDEVTTLEPGQVRKTDFLAQLRVAVCDAADRELVRAGRDTRGCPYIERWLAYYAERAANHLERAIRKFVPAASRVLNALEYIALVADRVAQGVRQWALTGELPEDIPPELREQIMAGGDVGQLIASAAARIGAAASSALSAVSGAIGGVFSAIGSLFFKPVPGRVTVSAEPSAIAHRLGPGRPLQGSARTRMESALGADLSRVRVHDDAGAAALSNELGAHAFALGEHVAFGAGNYLPGTPLGDALLAHELAHVVQQQGASCSAQAPDASVERDADTAAAAAVASLYAPQRTKLERRPSLRTGLRLSRCAGSPAPKESTVAPQTGGRCPTKDACSSDIKGDPGAFGERIKKAQTEEEKKVKEEAASGGPDAALLAAHGKPATATNKLLEEAGIAKPPFVHGIFINAFLGNTVGAQVNKCKFFRDPKPAGAPPEKSCVQWPLAKEKEAQKLIEKPAAKRTGTENVRAGHLVSVIVHEYQHPAFNLAADTIVPAAAASGECNLKTIVMSGEYKYSVKHYLSEMSAIIAEIGPIQKLATSAPSDATQKFLERTEDNAAWNKDESLRGIITRLRCRCSCSGLVDTFTEQVFNNASNSWSEAQKEEFKRAMTSRIPDEWPLSLHVK